MFVYIFWHSSWCRRPFSEFLSLLSLCCRWWVSVCCLLEQQCWDIYVYFVYILRCIHCLPLIVQFQNSFTKFLLFISVSVCVYPIYANGRLQRTAKAHFHMAMRLLVITWREYNSKILFVVYSRTYWIESLPLLRSLVHFSCSLRSGHPFIRCTYVYTLTRNAFFCLLPKCASSLFRHLFTQCRCVFMFCTVLDSVYIVIVVEFHCRYSCVTWMYEWVSVSIFLAVCVCVSCIVTAASISSIAQSTRWWYVIEYTIHNNFYYYTDFMCIPPFIRPYSALSHCFHSTFCGSCVHTTQ